MTKQFIAYFLLLYAVACASAGGIAHLVYRLALREAAAEYESGERIYVSGRMAMLDHIFEEIKSDLLYLSDQQALKLFLSGGVPDKSQFLAEDYSSFALRKKKYDQIRLICREGRELIRVNFNGGRVETVPAEALQNKSGRYYFKECLTAEGMYISPMDLNVEYGEIETPLKPVMRFGMCVNGLDGEKKAILILNYLGRHLLHRITHGGEGSVGDLMILNAKGYWIHGPVHDDLWGFMIKARARRTFGNQYPAAWEDIRDLSEGQTRGPEGIFTWETLSLGKERVWKVLSRIPPGTIAASIKEFKEKLDIYNGVIMGVLVIPVFLFVRMGYKRKYLKDELVRSASFDFLTGLANRSFFYTILDQTIVHAGRYDEKFSLLFIDIDGFKEVNDTLGHGIGDQLLAAVASRLKESVRASDIVARLGGDEFIVLLKKISGPAAAERVAEKVLKSLSTPFSLSPHTVRISASIGISLYPVNGDRSDLLVKQADNEMYKCKRRGKNTYSLCPPDVSGGNA